MQGFRRDGVSSRSSATAIGLRAGAFARVDGGVGDRLCCGKSLEFYGRGDARHPDLVCCFYVDFVLGTGAGGAGWNALGPARSADPPHFRCLACIIALFLPKLCLYCEVFFVRVCNRRKGQIEAGAPLGLVPLAPVSFCRLRAGRFRTFLPPLGNDFVA